MKRKGFTLVELLGVLTLIGLIAVIALPTVDSILKRSRNKSLENTKNSIKTAARNWLTDYKYLLSDNGDQIILTLGDLKELGYIDYDIKNPTTEICLSNSNKVTITRVKDDNNNRYDVELDEKLIDGDEEDCEAVVKGPHIYVNSDNIEVEYGTNSSVANVQIKSKLTAISKNGDDISSSVTCGSVNTTKIGTQSIKCSVTNSEVTKETTVKVNVVDKTAPVITGAPERIILSTTDTNLESKIKAGITATDNSGNVTLTVNTNAKAGVAGDYYAIITASDSSGNSTSVTITVIIK